MINKISATTSFTGSPMRMGNRTLAMLQNDLGSLVREIETLKAMPQNPERTAYIGNLEKQIEMLQNQIINKKTSMAIQMMMKS